MSKVVRNLKKNKSKKNNLPTREKILITIIFLIIAIIVGKLFYWQVVKADELRNQAQSQYTTAVTTRGIRGSIFFSDGSSLATNKKVFRLFAEPHQLETDALTLIDILEPILTEGDKDFQEASESAKKILETNLHDHLLTQLSKPEAKWIRLKERISEETKEKIAERDIKGIGFDEYQRRAYPEASMAAHLTGFVGKTEDGQDIGYFGLEGALEQELRARTRRSVILTDALGFQMIMDDRERAPIINGRDITLTIRRDIQYLAEESLKKALKKYGAESGEIIILDPKTGKLLALASQPSFDQEKFNDYNPESYKNPSLISVYEPGSTFKLLTVAAGLDAGAITPETECPNCTGPRQFGQFTIKTWNDAYNPNITMKDALAKSDNIAMIYIAEELGADEFQKYLHRFKIGEPIEIDLQGDGNTPFPETWRSVELATRSFGQGIGTTSMQLIRAVASIANQGEMMKPYVVEKVFDPLTGLEIETQPKNEGRIITKKTAQTLTEMMVYAAQSGEAQWIYSKNHPVAGKTGTSQIASAGSYDEEKTIASFIGFAPPEDPQFVMLVKLVAPTSSPWAAETAAPLWYSVANRLYLLFNISPSI